MSELSQLREVRAADPGKGKGNGKGRGLKKKDKNKRKGEKGTAPVEVPPK